MTDHAFTHHRIPRLEVEIRRPKPEGRRPKEGRSPKVEGSQHPTSNIQHRTSNGGGGCLSGNGCWMLDVRCSMFFALLRSAFGLRVSAFCMSTAPRKLTLEEWDARYAELKLAGLREASYGGPLRRRVSQDSNLRLRHLRFDNSTASLRLWNLFLGHRPAAGEAGFPDCVVGNAAPPRPRTGGNGVRASRRLESASDSGPMRARRVVAAGRNAGRSRGSAA